MSDRALAMTDERLDSLERWKDEMEKRFADAFPGGDHVGHCRYHSLFDTGHCDRAAL